MVCMKASTHLRAYSVPNPISYTKSPHLIVTGFGSWLHPQFTDGKASSENAHEIPKQMRVGFKAWGSTSQDMAEPPTLTLQLSQNPEGKGQGKL